MPTTREILEHMIGKSPWVNPEKTVDTIKHGDGDKPLKTVAVCWYPSIDDLQAAVDLGCDALFTHEPTWWDHWDKAGGWREKGPGRKKTELLERTGMVVPADKPGQWAEAITNLIATPTRRRTMATAAHHAMQSHSFKASFAQFWSAPERICQQSAAATSTVPIPGATAL